MASPALQPIEHHGHGRKEHVCRRHAQNADRHVMVVCTGEECRTRGSFDLLITLRGLLGSVTGDLRVSTSKCLGHCAAAPAMVENGSIMRWVSPRRLRSELIRLGIL
jgi:NADH:ubiquinone oxidoreductase subunit E